MALAWTGLHVLRLRTVLDNRDRHIGVSPSPQRESEDEIIRRVQRAISAVAARCSWATCLVQALAADVMLRRRGVSSVLRFGVRPDDTGLGGIEGHAWLECNGGAVVGAIHELSSYETMERASSIVDRPPSNAERQASIESLLSGAMIPWAAGHMTPAEFFQACSDLDLTCLVAEKLRTAEMADSDWPVEVRKTLATIALAQAAKELVRQQELKSVLEALAEENIYPILLKGTALAYVLYDSPAQRPRLDTDLLILNGDVDRTRRKMVEIGYREPTYCEGGLLFCQFPVKKTDRIGLTHTLDFHWKISTQSVFADLLDFEEMAAAAIHIPDLGRHARAAGFVHALLLACIHPVMHHRNARSPIWIYDIHLLACRLSATQFDQFADLAVRKKIAAICAHQLASAHAAFGTQIPDAVIAKLRAVRANEPSADYLRPDRRWSDDLFSSLRTLPSWTDRLRLTRQVVFPQPAYMLKTYELTPSALGAALLPMLYLHRIAYGGWKVISGRK